mmetsp:Transcript_30532/g.55579  ORF Transcript_30532/g.55579 Transcript_30532/m.55579 type:complete len:212 (+) Transcript_30532:313-948(+)
MMAGCCWAQSTRSWQESLWDVAAIAIIWPANGTAPTWVLSCEPQPLFSRVAPALYKALWRSPARCSTASSPQSCVRRLLSLPRMRRSKTDLWRRACSSAATPGGSECGCPRISTRSGRGMTEPCLPSCSCTASRSAAGTIGGRRIRDWRHCSSIRNGLTGFPASWCCLSCPADLGMNSGGNIGGPHRCSRWQLHALSGQWRSMEQTGRGSI